MPATTSKKEKTEKKKNRVSSDPLMRFLERTGMSDAEFSKAAKLGDGTVSTWRYGGSMPGWVLLVLEALHRRNKAYSTSPQVLVLKSSTPISKKTLDVLSALGLEVMVNISMADR